MLMNNTYTYTSFKLVLIHFYYSPIYYSRGVCVIQFRFSPREYDGYAGIHITL